ncbi:MAG: hypothetical protein N2485_04710 [bacterium]|nr:hypothetical protein [bacterium]
MSKNKIYKKLYNIFLTVFIVLLMLLNFISFSYGYSFVDDSYSYKGMEFKVKAWASRLTGSTTEYNSGNSYDLKDVYGFGGTKTSLQFELRKEINQHSFAYLAYFGDTRKSNVVLTSPVSFYFNQNGTGVVNLSAGDNLSTVIKVNSFDVVYGYYIGKNYEKGYAAVLAGIRFNNFAVDWTYNGSVNGSNSYRINGASGFLGLEGKYMLSENLAAFARVDGGVVGGGGKRVGIFEYELGGDLKLTNNLNLELGFKYADARARDELGNKLTLKYQGINGGLKFKF